MARKKLLKFNRGSFKSDQEEKDFLYSLLDFTLDLDAIEDDNPQLVSFAKQLLDLLLVHLNFDEAALILKDYYHHSWMPLFSAPEGDNFHSSLDFKSFLDFANSAYNNQTATIHPLKSLKGNVLTYPMVFKGKSIGVLFLFKFDFDFGSVPKAEHSLPDYLMVGTEAYEKMMQKLWYMNELENDAIQERLEISETQTILGKYISSQVMEKIIHSSVPLELEGRDVEITVLFADLCQFTKLSETLPSKKVVRLLNVIWSTLVEIAFKYHGTVDKFIGDCIMVVFNSPLIQRDHPFRACAMAIEFQEALKQLSELHEWTKLDLQLSIGINTGHATSGNIGSQERMEYTVIGDSVNVAARLEVQALPGEILISDELYSRIEGGFQAKRRGRLIIKGKSRSIQAYALQQTFVQAELDQHFLEYPSAIQKNILTSIAFASELDCAPLLASYLPQCERLVGIRILTLFESHFRVEMLPQLLDFLKSCKDPYLISKCVKTIGLLGGLPYLEVLPPFLNHPDLRVVSNTLEAIGLTQCEEIFPIVQPFLAHKHHRIRLRACQVCWNENPQLVISQFGQSLLNSPRDSQTAVIVMLNEAENHEILFSFLEHYARLSPEERAIIQARVKEEKHGKLKRGIEIAEEKLKSATSNP